MSCLASSPARRRWLVAPPGAVGPGAAERRASVAPGSPIAWTLLAFAEHDLNVARAADSIHVHPNTVKYRLRRIEELTGADVRRFHSAMEIVLGLATLDRVRGR